MQTVQDFCKIRRDGRVIEEDMTLERRHELGWPVSKITRIEWRCDGNTISLEDPRGLTSVILPDRSGVVLMLHTAQSSDEVLGVVNADGTSRFCLGNVQEINGEKFTGKYRWFQPTRINKPTVFGVVFGYTIKSQEFIMHPDVHLDVDAMTGEIISSHPTR